MKRYKCFFSILFWSGSVVATSSFDGLKVISSEYPPYSYRVKAVPTGFSVEILNLILTGHGSKQLIENTQYLPPLRTYRNLLSQQNSIILVLAKSADNENSFKWVGPIRKSPSVLISLRGNIGSRKGYQYISVPDQTYCTVANDSVEKFLLYGMGIQPKKLKSVGDPKLCLQMLLAERVGYYACDIDVAHWLMRDNHVSTGQFDIKYIPDQSEYHFAFNINTPDDLVRHFREAFDRIKATREYQKLFFKYFKSSI